MLKDAETLNVVPVLGLGRYFLYKPNEDRRVKKKMVLVEGEEWEAKPNLFRNNNTYLRIWMPKYDKSLADYVDERRKKLSPFSAH